MPIIFWEGISAKLSDETGCDIVIECGLRYISEAVAQCGLYGSSNTKVCVVVVR
jgi:hypothetical protein